MEYNDVIIVIMTVIEKYRHNQPITQGQFTNFMDALNILQRIEDRIEVTK